MKRNVLLAVVLALTPTLAIAQENQPGAADEARPVVDITERIMDFGVVNKGDKVTAEFEVKNTGTAPLEITNVRPTCGCTVASFDKTIPPGGSGKIKAEMDTASFSGPIAKAILVFTTDRATPQVNLVMKAEVRALIQVVPRPLLRLDVLQGEPATEKVTLIAGAESKFKVTGVDAGGGPYETSFRELAENERIANREGSQWEVAVTVPASAEQGVLSHKVVVKTDSPKAPEVSLNVSGIVRPIVQVVPNEINFGTVSAAAPVGRNIILINNRQGTELELTNVEVDTPGFTTEVIPLAAGQRFQVAVTLQPGQEKGTKRATLKIATSDPGRSSIEIPIQVTVQ